MKLLILLSSALALASAGYPLLYAPQHVPLLDHGGHPVDTPEVQAAKALHFAAHAAAAHGVPLVLGNHYGVHGAVGPDGRPLDTPEVQLAKAAHFIAYNDAAVRNSYGGHLGAVVAGPVAPIDTPEVQIAKAVHFAAHAKARGHLRKRRSPAYYGPAPQIGPNGVPQDTPEVAAAKAQHFAAHARNNAPAYNQGYNPAYNQNNNNNYQPRAEDLRYDGQYGYHNPVIGPDGVPQETPAVQAEKARHFSLYGQGGHLLSGQQAAQPQQNYNNPQQNYNNGYNNGQYHGPLAQFGPNGPIDTPEVAAAKAAHLAAHAANRHY